MTLTSLNIDQSDHTDIRWLCYRSIRANWPYASPNHHTV